MNAILHGIVPPALIGEIVFDRVAGRVGRVVGNLVTPYLSLIVSFEDGSENTVRFEQILPATEEQMETFTHESMAVN
jgi:hypothetical protein